MENEIETPVAERSPSIRLQWYVDNIQWEDEEDRECLEEVRDLVSVLEAENARLRAMAEYLAKETIGRQCELTADRGYKRCPDPAVAVRWEDGFADDVCEEHAQSALDRGRATVIYSRARGARGRLS